MALIASGLGDRPRAREPSIPADELREEAAAWVRARECNPNDLELSFLLSIGYALHTIGSNPDLEAQLYDRLGVPYTVRERLSSPDAFGTRVVRRTVVRQEPEPEPQPEPEPERKKRPWGRGRDSKLDLRLSDDERREIEAAAAAAGVTRGEWARRQLWNAAQGDRAWRGETVDREWLREIQRREAARMPPPPQRLTKGT